MTERQTWHFTIELLPGSPGSERLLPVFELLIGDDMLMKATKLESSKLDMADPASHLAENYPVFQTRTRKGFPMFVYGRGGSHMLVDFTLTPGGGGSLSGFLTQTQEAVVTTRVSAIVDELGAPFALVYAGERDNSITRRSSVHREAAKAALGPSVFPFWIKWGLPGLAYRTLFGKPLIEMFGEERLQGLSDEVAWTEGDHWVVAGCARPEDWTFNPPCDQERQIIGQLGPQHFFDIETSRLPTVLPTLPETPDYPVMLRNPETDEIETVSASSAGRPQPSGGHRPRVEAVSGRAGPAAADDEETRPDFERKARFVKAQMTEMVPEFETDDTLYWVEEFLAGKPAVQHADLIDSFGAWLGEHLRAKIGGDWVETEAGWVVAAPSGTTWDAYGRVTEFLLDRDHALKSFVAAAIGERGQGG